MLDIFKKYGGRKKKRTLKRRMRGGMQRFNIRNMPETREAARRWRESLVDRFQESVRSGNPDYELAELIMRHTPINQRNVRAIPLPGHQPRPRPGPGPRLVLNNPNDTNIPTFQAQLVRNVESPISEPNSPDRDLMQNESVRNIQRRFRGNRQRRMLNKQSPRHGRMKTPKTDRERMRRWMDLSRMYEEDDPIRGYEQYIEFPERIHPQRGGKRTIKKKRTMRKKKKTKKNIKTKHKQRFF